MPRYQGSPWVVGAFVWARYPCIQGGVQMKLENAAALHTVPRRTTGVYPAILHGKASSGCDPRK